MLYSSTTTNILFLNKLILTFSLIFISLDKENEQENGTGTGDTVVEEPVVEETAAEGEEKSSDKVSEAMEQASKSLNDAFKQEEKQVGSISKALGRQPALPGYVD